VPPGATVIQICEALRHAQQPASALFLDNNHMSEEGARIAGEALAQGISDLGLGP